MDKCAKSDFNRGMLYHRGLDIATRYYNQGLHILLTDQELKCLKIASEVLKEEKLTKNIYFGTTDVLIAPFITNVLEAYSKYSVIRNGLSTLEQIGMNIWGTDLYESPFIEQIEKIKYKPIKNDKR